jgi:hypothetical protein
MKSDTSPFWKAALEARSLLSSDRAALARFDVLLKQLPPDFFDVRLVPARGTDDEEGALVVLPGPYIETLVATLRANAHVSLPSRASA